MNKINIHINFEKQICDVTGINLITGDFNSTKLIFDFDREDGTKLFKMKNPNDETIFTQTIENNEIILVGQTGEGEKASIFNSVGDYPFEVALYEGDSRLTSAYGILSVSEEQVVIDASKEIEVYKPLFDTLLEKLNVAFEEVENIDISSSKEGHTTTITITKKDGSPQVTEIEDGEKGDKGDKGDIGDTGVGIVDIHKTSTQGRTDTYTIYLSDGTNYTFTVTNGEVGGTYDYEELSNRPKINNVELLGNKSLDDLNIELKSKTGNNIVLTVDSSTYIMTLKLRNSANEVLSTQTIDLPLETMVVGAEFDEETKEIILKLQNGQTVRFSVADLVSGLQTEITPTNMLNSDLVDDTTGNHKFVTQEMIDKINSFKSGGNVYFIEENSEDNPFVFSEHEIGVYHFIDSVIYFKATPNATILTCDYLPSGYIIYFKNYLQSSNSDLFALSSYTPLVNQVANYEEMYQYSFWKKGENELEIEPINNLQFAFPQMNSDATITGKWNYETLPTSSTIPTNGEDIVTKNYVDSIPIEYMVTNLSNESYVTFSISLGSGSISSNLFERLKDKLYAALRDPRIATPSNLYFGWVLSDYSLYSIDNIDMSDFYSTRIQSIRLVALNNYGKYEISTWFAPFKQSTNTSDLRVSWSDVSSPTLEVVKLSSNQTIGGLKTFNRLPQSDLTPTDEKDFTTKKYVDENVGGTPTYILTTTTSDEDRVTMMQNVYDLYKQGKIASLTYVDANNNVFSLFDVDKFETHVDFYVKNGGLAQMNYGVGYYAFDRYKIECTYANDIISAVEISELSDMYVLADTSQILGTGNTHEYTPTGNYNPATKEYVDKIHYENIVGYDATKTQVLKNINGVLTWVDEA